ncbi:hypothetical protein GMORB2_7739 [Geosmithia morbida]|uniref:Uncharacterized protein n=1 Tax=Geosmithia morbida TaxID=1094350 RepID=A0A9P5D341_9HYPO|nr:uncharacterized protein GMORB2_7739 [Geosmithia morbida]KAF4122146.1 hypothetical protein GMORB2_7739 [Geosmithia morbida]
MIASSLSVSSPEEAVVISGASPPSSARRVTPAVNNESALTRVGNGDCQIPRPGEDAGASADKAIIVESIIQDEAMTRLSTAELYGGVVRREVPFIPTEYLAGDDDSALSPVLRHCVRLAGKLSLATRCGGLSDTDLHELHTLLASRCVVDLSDCAGLMLLLSRIQPDSRLVDRVLLPLSTSNAPLENTPMPIAVGCLTSYSWLSLVGFAPLPTLPPFKPSTILDYRDTTEPGTWAPHYLKLTHLAASFVHLRRTTQGRGNTPDTTVAWAELEYTTLLNVAQMPSEYLDVRDDMPATPAATITHMLQTLVFLRIYQHLLYHNPSLGQAIGLRPVPGVIHFICALARSVFICPSVVINHWPILGDIQATTVEVLLDMWKLTKAGNCRSLLNLWKPVGTRFDGLARHVRDQIGSGPWDVEMIDGYSVFWMFRDLRSLSLEGHMRKPDGAAAS